TPLDQFESMSGQAGRNAAAPPLWRWLRASRCRHLAGIDHPPDGIREAVNACSIADLKRNRTALDGEVEDIRATVVADWVEAAPCTQRRACVGLGEEHRLNAMSRAGDDATERIDNEAVAWADQLAGCVDTKLRQFVGQVTLAQEHADAHHPHATLERDVTH